MPCLSSAQIQAVADHEGSAAEREHAAECAACEQTVASRQAVIASVRTAMDAVEMPPAAAGRIHTALAGAGESGATGATRLRHAAAGAPQWYRAAWGTAAVAAATLVAVVFIAPLVKEGEATVSASEVLAHSASQLAQSVASGVETLEYELVLDGVSKEMLPDHGNGTYRVRQTIDHGTPGRFRFASYGPDGAPLSSIAQDPASRRRVMAVNVEGQWFRFDMSIPKSPGPSLPELERLHMEATIGMMQASGQHLLQVVDSPDGRQFEVQVPKGSAPLSNPVWDLAEARVVVDASDYRVKELAVKGTFLKQAYTISYRLISREVTSDVIPGTFEVPAHAGEILISGDGTAIPVRDAMVLALRDLAQLKRAR